MKKKSSINLLRIIATTIILLGIIYYYFNIFAPEKIPYVFKMGTLNSKINILVLGTDVTYNDRTNQPNWNTGRSDSIMILSYSPKGDFIKLISVPRDSYVSIPGYGYSKINASFVLGGVDLTKKTLEDLLGLKFDKYLIINTRGIIKLVDILGGVTVDVEKDLNYVDRAGKLFIHLKKGIRRLNGKEAEGFVRFRHDALGDITRMERQQKFLKAITVELASPSSIAKAPFIAEIIFRNIQTNIPIKDFFKIANTMRMLPKERIKVETLPGEPSNNEAGSVILLNHSKIQAIIKEL